MNWVDLFEGGEKTLKSGMEHSKSVAIHYTILRVISQKKRSTSNSINRNSFIVNSLFSFVSNQFCIDITTNLRSGRKLSAKT